MSRENETITATADRLAELYSRPFGGKKAGRFRISARFVREYAGRRRLYEDDVRALQRALLERGFVMIDMESFFVVMGANSFVNYRRANADCITR